MELMVPLEESVRVAVRAPAVVTMRRVLAIIMVIRVFLLIFLKGIGLVLPVYCIAP